MWKYGISPVCVWGGGRGRKQGAAVYGEHCSAIALGHNLEVRGKQARRGAAQWPYLGHEHSRGLARVVHGEQHGAGEIGPGGGGGGGEGCDDRAWKREGRAGTSLQGGTACLHIAQGARSGEMAVRDNRAVRGGSHPSHSVLGFPGTMHVHSCVVRFRAKLFELFRQGECGPSCMRICPCARQPTSSPCAANYCQHYVFGMEPFASVGQAEMQGLTAWCHIRGVRVPPPYMGHIHGGTWGQKQDQ